MKVAVFSLLVEEFEPRRSPLGLPRSLDVATDLAELPESLMTRIEQQGSRGVMGHQIGVYQDLSRPVSLIFASWNQLAGWLSQIEGLRAAGA